VWFFYDCFSSNICKLDPALTKGPTQLIHYVAQIINKHIAEHAVNPKSEMKPHIALQTLNPINVIVGEEFIIKLKEAKNLHSRKRSEIENPNIVLQVANRSALGEYKFYAAKARETKVRLVVAYKTSLAVAFQDVDIVVSEPFILLEQQFLRG